MDRKRERNPRRNAFWFMVAGAGIGASFFVHSPYMAYSIYAFLLLVGIAHYSTLAWLAGLDCERSVSKTTLQQGDAVDVDVTVSNKRGWPIPWIFLEDVFPPFCHRAGDNTACKRFRGPCWAFGDHLHRRLVILGRGRRGRGA